MVSGIALYKMENKVPRKINNEIDATQTKDSFFTGLKQVLSEKDSMAPSVRTDGRADGRTAGRTDGRTEPKRSSP